MGGLFSTRTASYSAKTNRVPIITPRHVPREFPYEDTAYSKFNPELYRDKFAYPQKEPPKYW